MTRVQGTVAVSDGGATISVDDGGSSLTVDGTVAVSGTVTAAGNREDNTGLPGTALQGVLAACATAAAPTKTEGRLVVLSTDLSGALRVTGSSGGTSKVDDAAFTVASDSVTPAGGLYQSSVDTVDDGDTGALSMTRERALKVSVVSGYDGNDYKAQVTSAGEQVVKLGSITSAVRIETQGDISHDTSYTGTNPVLLGAGGSEAITTALGADSRVVRLWADRLGRLVIAPLATRSATVQNQITLTDTTETTLIAAVASYYNELTQLVITNTSSTAVRVDIRDDTAGTVRLSVAIAANGGAVIPFHVPMRATAVNKNWTAKLSGSVTDIRIFAQAITVLP